MERFVEVYRDRIVGTLSGFDRMLFCGTLRGLAYVGGLMSWLSAHGVLLKDFSAFSLMMSKRLKDHAKQLAEAAGWPFRYIGSPAISREAWAESIRRRKDLYDKQGSVLRIETTNNDPRRFRVRRTVTRAGRRVRKWVPMRKGLADLPRRVEVSRAANKRHLEAHAEVQISATACEVLDPVSRRVNRHGWPHRALCPLSAEEATVFQSMLGGHGLITKVSHTNYYRLTIKGHRVMTTSLKLRQFNLTALAA